jgi:cyclophilin family peptidyl-prolyl cis-trans isomerase
LFFQSPHVFFVSLRNITFDKLKINNTVDFIVQFGIASEPDETKNWDVTISDDAMHVQSNIRGTLSFATAGPTTRTTQLFINVRNNPSLDQMGFTPIGIILTDSTDGTDPMDTIIPNIAVPNTNPGEDGIDQGQYMEFGNAWLLSQYPGVDMIINTTLLDDTDDTISMNDDEENETEEFDVDDENVHYNNGGNSDQNDGSITTATTTMIGHIADHEEEQQFHRFQHRNHHSMKTHGNHPSQ